MSLTPFFSRTKEEQDLLTALDNATDKLSTVCALFRCITQQPPCSFRRLIYERLGFQGIHYEDLYQAGGMEITNAISDYQDMLTLSKDETFD